MSTEDNKALVRRWYEDFNQRNLAIVDELFTPDYVYHNPPTTLHGPEEFKQFLSLYVAWHASGRVHGHSPDRQACDGHGNWY
jgi:ketosteroid isomerase-like protein